MATTGAMIGPNPYIGPNSFGREDQGRFYGRDYEIRQLAALVVARQIVLFYAPSGAGKTSLLQAGLIPDLENKHHMTVLPIVRVRGDANQHAGGDGNLFVANLLADLGVADPAGLDLEAGLAPLAVAPEHERRPRPRLLIIDQFEEIFTSHPDRLADRSDFFRQLQATLTAHPRLSVLISMREDYIAHLDFYSAQMADRMRTRFRMERLTAPGALAAITLPAEAAGRTFGTGVAQGLVDNLRRVQRPKRGDPMMQDLADEAVYGEFVEPVHLQIVCQELWEKLPADQVVIQADDVKSYGDVDEALARFYERALVRAKAETGINLRLLRGWFTDKLITSARTRSLLSQDEAETAGLPNGVVQALRETYILRAVDRGGNIFIELAHDRLVEPILAANLNWQTSYPNPLALPAERWHKAGRPDTDLLSGPELAAAKHFEADHQDELLPVEKDYLARSLALRARRRRTVTILGVVGGLILISLASLWWLNGQVKEAEARGERLREVALSRQLAGVAEDQLALGNWLNAGRSATTAGDSSATSEAFFALRQLLDSPLRVERIMDGERGQAIDLLAVSPGGQWAATGDRGGTVQLWDLRSGLSVTATQVHTTSQPSKPVVAALAWDPTGQFLVSGGGGTLHLIDATQPDVAVDLPSFTPDQAVFAQWRPGRQPQLAAAGGQTLRIWLDLAEAPMEVDLGTAHTGTLQLISWSPDGLYLLSADSNGVLELWDGESGKQLRTFSQVHTGKITDVDWQLDGQLYQLASAADDGTVVLWNLTEGTSLRFASPHRGAECAMFCESIEQVMWVPPTPGSAGQMVIGVGSAGRAYAWHTDKSSPQSQFALPRQGPEAMPGLPAGQGRILTTSWHTDPREDWRRRGNLLTGDNLNQVRLWDVDSGNELAILQGHTDMVVQALWSEDGRVALTGDRNEKGGSLLLWDVLSARETGRLDEMTGAITALEWGRDESEVLVADAAGVLFLVGIQSTAELPVLHTSSDVHKATWSDQNTKILVTQSDGAAMWDAQTGKLDKLYSPPDGVTVSRADFKRSGDQLLLSASDGRAYVYRLDGQALPIELSHPSRDESENRVEVEFARWDLNETVMVTGATDGTVRIWDAHSFALRCHIDVADDDPDTHDIARKAQFQNADGARMVVTSVNGSVGLWDTSTPNECSKITELPNSYTGSAELAWEAYREGERSRLLVFGLGGLPQVWDVDRMELLHELVDSEQPVSGYYSGQWSSDNQWVVLLGSDGVLRLWDADTGQLLQRFVGDLSIRVYSFADDNTRLLAGDNSGAIHLWQVGSEADDPSQTELRLLGHTQPVLGAVFMTTTLTVDNEEQVWPTVLSWGEDGTARLWKVDLTTNSAEVYAVLTGHTGAVLGAVYNRQNNQIMTWADDGTVRRYYVQMGDLLASVCALAPNENAWEACIPN